MPHDRTGRRGRREEEKAGEEMDVKMMDTSVMRWLSGVFGSATDLLLNVDMAMKE